MIKVYIPFSNKKVFTPDHESWPEWYYIKNEVITWLDINLINERACVREWLFSGCNFNFNKTEEAVLFKLTWG